MVIELLLVALGLGLLLVELILACGHAAIAYIKEEQLLNSLEANQLGAKSALNLFNSPTQQSSLRGIIWLNGGLATLALGFGLIELFSVTFQNEALIVRYSGTILLCLLAAAASALCGELLPARIGQAFAPAFARFLAPAIIFYLKILSPVSWILLKIQRAICSLLRVPEMIVQEITEEELKDLVERSSETGAIEEAESDIVSKVFRLDDRLASSLMTPQQDLVWLDSTKPPSELLYSALGSGYSCFPIARGALDQTLGTITLHDLAQHVLARSDEPLDALIKDGLRVPSNVSALKVLQLFREQHADVGLVFDEHGAFEGLITLHDLLEAIVGSLGAREKSGWTTRADGSYLVDAALDLVDLFELLGLESEAHEVAPGYHSLGGLIFHQLGHIPKEGESTEFNGFRIEVVDMDGMRIDKVLITKLASGDLPD